jgi:hypothetical protein
MRMEIIRGAMTLAWPQPLAEPDVTAKMNRIIAPAVPGFR